MKVISIKTNKQYNNVGDDLEITCTLDRTLVGLL